MMKKIIISSLTMLALLSCNSGGYSSLVDPFWGSGAYDGPVSEGLARGWSWEKARSGNTHPGAVLPFGWVSACGFSGGYSSGYGRVGYSSCEVPPMMLDSLRLWGISHFHQSGVGLMRKFYNYFLFTPYCAGADLSRASSVSHEKARPGYYAATLPDYGASFELTVRSFAALHRYNFGSGEGHLRIDAAHAGLGTQCFQPIRPSEKAETIQSCTLGQVAEGEWAGTMRAYGVDIHFAFITPSNVLSSTLDGPVLDISFAGKDAEIIAGFSLESIEKAVSSAREALDAGFKASRILADNLWDEALGRVRARFSDPVLERRFYSALYQSMIKPCECGPGRFTDFTTFWDVYHSELPLMLSFAPGKGRGMVEHLFSTIDSLGFCPISQILDTTVVHKDNQATALPVYTLCDAFWRGVISEAEYPRLKRVLEKEFAHADISGTPPSHTLDLSGAYSAAAFVAGSCSDTAFADSLRALARIWKDVYDPATGLLFENAQYYEGNHFNYSFRAHLGMSERISMAGGRDGFQTLLDRFFRFIPDFSDWSVDNDRARRRNYFEGLNNEPDMDTPYSYLWCGRPDRTAEVIDAVRRFRYADGEGGCPGNNDAGATGSWYVWNSLGIYPLAGTPYYMLGSPSVDSAGIDFASGTLDVEVRRESPDSIYPAGYEFDGVAFSEPWIEVSRLEKGGRLVFHLKDTPSSELAPVPQWLDN